MKTKRDEFNDALRSLIDAERNASDKGEAAAEHLSPEDLLAYYTGRQTAAQADRAQEHLAHCRACVQMLLDLDGFASLENSSNKTDADLPRKSEMAAAWSALQSEIAKNQGTALKTQTQTPDAFDEVSARRASNRNEARRRKFWFASFAPYSIAASLLLISISLFIWMLFLRRENRALIAQLREEEQRAENLNKQISAERAARQTEDEQKVAQNFNDARNQPPTARAETTQRAVVNQKSRTESKPPRRQQTSPASSPPTNEREQVAVNVFPVELYPSETLRGEPTSEVKQIQIPPNARLIALTLNSASQKSFDAYALDIINESGAVVWSGSGLRKSGNNTFTVALPTQLLSNGRYRFKLSGVSQGRREPIEEYAAIIEKR